MSPIKGSFRAIIRGCNTKCEKWLDASREIADTLSPTPRPGTSETRCNVEAPCDSSPRDKISFQMKTSFILDKAIRLDNSTALSRYPLD